MAYNINYEHMPIKTPVKEKKRSGKFIASILIPLVIFALVLVMGDRLYEYLLPGDPAVTEAAACGFVENIRNGSSVKDAATAFCQQIIDSAEPSYE